MNRHQARTPPSGVGAPDLTALILRVLHLPMLDEPCLELTEPFDSGRPERSDWDIAAPADLADLALRLLDILIEPESTEAWAMADREGVENESVDEARPPASRVNNAVIVVAITTRTPGLGSGATRGCKAEPMARETHRLGIGRSRHRREDDQPC